MVRAMLAFLAILSASQVQAAPKCLPTLIEELIRQKIKFESGVSETQDSEILLDEYTVLSDELIKIEDKFPIPAEPERQDFKSDQAFKRALTSYRETLPDMKASRDRLLEQRYPNYRKLKSDIEKFTPEKNETFSELVANGVILYDQVLHFEKDGKPLVDAYLKEGKINSFRTLFPQGDRDFVMLGPDCKVDFFISKHGKFTQTVKEELCEDLNSLKHRFDAAVREPYEPSSDDDICEFQGGKISDGQCRCQPGPRVIKPMFEIIEPEYQSCFKFPAVSPVKILKNFVENRASRVVSSPTTFSVIERGCKRYFGLPKTR